jgi:uncharacterized membrane protein
MKRGRFGLPLAALAGAGVLIALYLTWEHVAGGVPPCGPLRGSLAWWLRGDRRGLVVAYLAELASLAALAYLTYLELFVIHAVCAWCVTYAITVLAGWLVALAAYRTSGPSPAQ